ncbi:MAG: sigma-54 dependent transcriptional regulator [Myxococcaceae bacterium]
MNVLVVDDQRSARMVLSEFLEAVGGVVVVEAQSAAEVEQATAGRRVDLAFVDLRLSDDVRDRQGLELARRLRDERGALVVIVTGLSELTEVRAAMRLGVFDYMLKEQLSLGQVADVVAEARGRLKLEREVLVHRAQRVAGADLSCGLIGASAAMERLRDLIRRVAVSDRPVLVTGPSGSGKELVVRGLHALGANPQAPLLELNCGALPEALVESQLFGHERGAFTGAERRLPGLLAAVGEGTLFLDEIAEMPLMQQPKLLRVLETRRYRPVGSTTEQTFQGRVIAATHADLEERMQQGRFREDLFHRLAVLRLRVPSLAERPDDIPALVAHFAESSVGGLFSPEAIAWLVERAWPGEVRQLRNLVDQAPVMIDERPIGRAALEGLVEAQRSRPWRRLASEVLSSEVEGDKLELVERTLVAEALARTGGNKSAAAKLLGVHRKQVERRADSDPFVGQVRPTGEPER